MDTRREKIEDLLKFEGIECKGFGVLPKFVMRDVDLGIGAKGLYAYYCSLAGSEIVAFPRRETILRQLKINKETFYRYQEELIREGYISVQQIREKSQLFGANVYTLVQNPKKLQMTRIDQEVKEGYDFAYYAGLKSHLKFFRILNQGIYRFNKFEKNLNCLEQMYIPWFKILKNFR